MLSVCGNEVVNSRFGTVRVERAKGNHRVTLGQWQASLYYVGGHSHFDRQYNSSTGPQWCLGVGKVRALSCVVWNEEIE